MKKTQYLMWLAVLLCASLGTTAAWGQTFEMRGTVSPDVTKLPTFGDASPTLTLPLQIWLKPRDQAGLNSLLAEQQDPKSPHYHQWLTPQEYATRFGPSQAAFDRISKWLADQGFQVTGGSPAAGFIGVRGTVLTIAPNGNTCVAGTGRNVNELASHPLITSVGGTAFSASAFAGPNWTVVAHTRERAWNDSDDPDGAIQGGGATGGGASAYFSKPNFQNTGTPNDGARDQPDVALIASPYYPGTWFFDDDGSGAAVMLDVGGTSLAAPTWAGIVNLLVQKTSERVGSVNPTLYRMAGQSNAGFYDIAAGDNNFNGVQGFSAGVGYDQATGWGTVDIATFVNAYAAEPSSTATPTPIPTATSTPTSTTKPTPTPTTKPTPTPTIKPTPTTRATSTPTTTPPTPTPTGKSTPTPTPKPTPTPAPTATPTPRVPAYVKVSASSLNFGSVRVGRSKVKVVRLTNTAPKKGGATVTFNGESVSGAGEFLISTTCSGQVAPTRTCSLTVGFSPSSPGAASAMVTIKGNASNSPHVIGVIGAGK